MNDGDPFAFMTVEASKRLRDARIDAIPIGLGRVEYERRWTAECNAHLARTYRAPSKGEEASIEAEEAEYRKRIEAWSRRIDARFEADRRIHALYDLPAFIGEGI